MKFDAVYYEPDCLSYTLGAQLKEQFCGLPWIPIESHNSIKEMLIAPVILTDDWKKLYTELLEELESGLSARMKKEMFLEIILMTYSYVHRAINQDAFPGTADLYNQELMTGRGRGRYCYRPEARAEAEVFLRAEVNRILGDVQILYIS